jgi:hypothetical protein
MSAVTAPQQPPTRPRGRRRGVAPAEDSPDEDAQYRPHERGVKGEKVADRHRPGKHPLPDRDVRQDPVDQLGRELIHPAAATRKAEAAPWQERATIVSSPQASRWNAHEPWDPRSEGSLGIRA